LIVDYLDAVHILIVICINYNMIKFYFPSSEMRVNPWYPNICLEYIGIVKIALDSLNLAGQKDMRIVIEERFLLLIN